MHALLEIALAAVFDGHGGHSAADYMSKNLYKILSVSIEDEKKDSECQIEGKLLSHQMQCAPFGLLSLSCVLKFSYVYGFCYTIIFVDYAQHSHFTSQQSMLSHQMLTQSKTLWLLQKETQMACVVPQNLPKP